MLPSRRVDTRWSSIPEGRPRLTNDAGWSSPVARWAHNPKVVSSNLTPATNQGPRFAMALFFAKIFRSGCNSMHSVSLFEIESLERVAGIEPACAAWKAAVLPLNYTRAELNPTITVLTLRTGASLAARSIC
jgi:hypothetical protein